MLQNEEEMRAEDEDILNLSSDSVTIRRALDDRMNRNEQRDI